MLISDILARKGHAVQSIPHGHTVSQAAGVMHEHHIGAVVVVNARDGLPLGIVSQGEILAAIHDFGQSSLAHCATGIMRKPVPSCSEGTSVQDATRQMTRERSRHLLVYDEAGSMSGIVSLGDLAAARLNSCELEANVLRDMALTKMLAS